MTADRPTGPATGRIRRFVGPHFDKRSPQRDDLEEALVEAAAAERARILAALPEALMATFGGKGWIHFTPSDPAAEWIANAAALAAAIEKLVE